MPEQLKPVMSHEFEHVGVNEIITESYRLGNEQAKDLYNFTINDAVSFDHPELSSAEIDSRTELIVCIDVYKKDHGELSLELILKNQKKARIVFLSTKHFYEWVLPNGTGIFQIEIKLQEHCGPGPQLCPHGSARGKILSRPSLH